MSRTVRVWTLLTAIAVFAAPAGAGSGHLLHGVGAVNSAMGGAGVALANDALGALSLNPALLTQLDGHRIEFSTELADDTITVDSEVGPFSGATESSADPEVIPSAGFTAHRPDSKFAFGLGYLGVGGFGADFPQASSNPVFAPQPFGLGHLYARYALTSMPVAVAYQVNDSLSLGGALLVGRASLAARPARFASPDCSAATVCFTPSTDSDSAWGFGAQLGMFYRIGSAFGIGLAYQSELSFEDFEWNSSVANPNLPTFGTNRTLALQVNSPASVTVGVGFSPGDRFEVALDAKQIFFADAAGFADALDWEDVTAYGLGVQFKATDRFALRAGYHHADSAIPDRATFFNVGSSTPFGEHASVGFGVALTEAMTLNAAYYRVLAQEISGPIHSASGPVPGTRVTTETTRDSVIAAISFDFD